MVEFTRGIERNVEWAEMSRARSDSELLQKEGI
mgnify:CR=1 FL=1